MNHSATYSPDDNKLRLYPAHRLDADEYARVKAAGFKWAPRQELFVKPSWSPEAEDLLTEMAGEIGDEDTSLVNRAEQRADRFEDYSEKRMADAERARKAVAEIADNIPFGQPILVGHHSEKHARRDKEKIDAGMRKAVQMWRTSQYWTARAEGAIRHAKYKELPAVRHRRIKTIEAERRRTERTKADSQKWLALWTVSGLTIEQARAIANQCWFTVIHDGAHNWTAYDVLRSDEDRSPRCPAWTVEQVQEKARESYPHSIEHCDRWLGHLDNRLAYERAMLAEQIGGDGPDAPASMGERFAFQVGGKVQIARERSGAWMTIIRVNRVGGAVNSLTTTSPPGVTWASKWKYGVEEVSDYQAPEGGDAEKVKTASQLAPLCNYPGEGFFHMTAEEYKKKHKDYKCTKLVKETDQIGMHRVRHAMLKDYKTAHVFITDAKRVDPPKIAPPSEPAEPAEFVREFVARPDADLDAALSLVSEIMGERQETAEPAATLAPAAEPLRVLGDAKTEAQRAGAEIVTGLGQYRAGRGEHVTDWCETEADAWQSFCEIAGIPFAGGATPKPAKRLECTIGEYEVWEDSANRRWTVEHRGEIVHICRDGLGQAIAFADRVNDAGKSDSLPATADLPRPSPTADFEAMRAMLKGGGVQVVVAPQLFPTSPTLADEVVELADIQPGQDVLEPSAGTGALLRAMPNVRPHGTVTAVEINPRLADALREIADRTFCANFLECGADLLGTFDIILMNPPFENGDDIKHILHARTLLRPGGRIVAICANGPRQRDKLMPIASEWRDLPAGSFKHAGTSVNTALLVIERPPG
ncbi:DUF3560 domain-containing protein [Bradyrhizobium barranii subsp. apii]|uniref:DUF3560 domain-containing protein n=1 Tax=Bradyrhizobium barranii TaxID=2992140 RepID=UPI001AA19F52|nr:DUF3560 domain-containing protein [Bradyrhizobium barranii]UPT99358.1 DUF3560 domain-containing protein [Bradyrhizobium barranii subsp. apii]